MTNIRTVRTFRSELMYVVEVMLSYVNPSSIPPLAPALSLASRLEQWSQCKKSQERGENRSECLEFKEDADRCGVKMTQLMLRAALADDWY